MDYQKTLNLPQTEFSMRAGLVNKEPVMLEEWEKSGLYDKIRQQSEGKPPFILHDGPPYANGNIHIGHALNKILKDMIVKYKTVKGFDSLYVPGWDCHGLPIEHQLLKEMKARKNDVECVSFRQSAHDYAMKYVGIQREQFQRLGIYGQWDDPYLTLSPEYEYWILKSLGELTRRGYVYHSLKPVNWDPASETALAESEVEYEDHVSPSVYTRFVVKNPEAIGDVPDGKRLCLLIWTTTPWTLLANVAVAVHETFDYVLVEVGDDVLILEESLSSKIFEKAGITDAKIIKKVKGKDLVGLKYTQPFEKLDDCPVVLADYVTKEDGSGLVHTAPGHGQDDYQTGLKYELPVLMPVNERGVFTDEGAPFEGQFVLKANKNIIENLSERNLLLLHEDFAHQYPHSARTKGPIIFRATEQWFIKIDHEGLRTRLKEVVQEEVEWFPESGQERIMAMVTLRPDWCLSRQRYWGVPIPALIDKKSGEQKLYPELIDHLADIVRKEGSDVWFKKDLKDLLPEGFKDPETGSTDFEKTSDILDVWFDSGVSHRAVFHGQINRPLPADLYLEGSDQHRGWFQSSIIPSVAIDGKAPYRQVLTHGFVVDGEGRKMSKSLGNVIAPADFIKNSGADILRLWVASSNYHDDIRLSKEVISGTVDAYRKIRNTARFLLSNLYDFNPDEDQVEYDQMEPLDRWILHRLAQLIQKVDDFYHVYDFSSVYKTLFDFCNEDCSTIFLDILKDRLYASFACSVERRSAQTAIYHICDALVRLISPILVFTSEEIFQSMPKSKATQVDSVHLLGWPEIDSRWHSSDLEEEFKLLFELRPFVLKALEEKRRGGEIGSSLEAKIIFETASDRDGEYLEQLQSFLSQAFIVSQVEINRVSDVVEGFSEQFAKTNVKIEKADGEKCQRCWIYTTDVGQNSKHPTLCVRCSEVVSKSVTA